MMRQDRFTQQAQEVLAASQEMVRQQRHSQWDVEHVLLALLQHQDGLAGKILEAMGVDADRSLRVSVGWSSTPADVERFVEVFPGIVERLRGLRAS